ncbi:hypothetical protein [Nannocystis radixulma]|uniref:Lipoprotein n=1 Tax=Nannocystis radixulma TaxID=2995305 RepID=A0ABT5B594_9BACT|nr:hypothetical protein [Nannocystis radixulma]MDC0668883.1 hypothetical protein [Nannocystis radixulma]
MHGRCVAVSLLLSLGPGCERAPTRPVEAAPTPAAERPAPPEPPPPDVDPAALPVCGKDMSQEPLAAICALSRPARDQALGCAEPEAFMWCSNTRPGYTKWGCMFPLADSLPPVLIYLQTATEGEAPKLGTIIEPKPISGTVAAAEVAMKAASEAAGVELVAGWRAQLERWGCAPIDEPRPEWVELQCGRFEVLLNYSDITDSAYVKASLPGVAACWR